MPLIGIAVGRKQLASPGFAEILAGHALILPQYTVPGQVAS